MALDGFSMGNLGLNTELTPSQIAGQVEQLSQKESRFEVKTLNKSAKDNGVKRKKEEENGNSKRDFDSNDQDDEKEDQTEFFRDPTSENKVNIKDFENGNLKDFSIRINEKTNKVELLNLKENRVMESIDAEDLMNVISKLNYASGIFVNRKI